MELLQREVPILFDLVGSIKHLPKKQLIPLIEDIISRVLASYPDVETQSESDNMQLAESVIQELSYFPTLPKIRVRGGYETDKQSHSKLPGCTKKSSGHPSLLPGIFTLYCPHAPCKD